MPTGRSPACAARSSSALDHVAAGGDHDDVHLRLAVRPRPRDRPPPSRAPPGRAASGCGPGPGSGSRSSSSFASSIGGSRRVRTATRWLAIPRRTLRESLCSANSSLSARAERLGVGDLALADDARASGATPCAVTSCAPLTETSVAAMLLASISRPTSCFWAVLVITDCLQRVRSGIRAAVGSPSTQSAHTATT